MSDAIRKGPHSTLPFTEAPDEPQGDGPTAGATIGRFVVIGLLGRGGMGVVLSAYDPLLDRRVALKLLRPGRWPGVSESEGRTRLQREAQAMAKLAHPNVVTVHDVGAVGEQLFIAMEFIDGQTLSSWLEADARGWPEIVRVFVAAGQGLQAAHAAGLVHRDFKPENVIIGKDGRPRVGDFGLVSVTRVTPGEAPFEDGATRQGAVLGTPGYMAPEQARGDASDAQSDQFSFCVALYEALYGQRPFAADRQQRAVLDGGVLPPPRKSDVPRWLHDVLLRGLRVRRDERWPSMQALLDALSRDPARQRRRAIRAAAAVLVAVALAVGVRATRQLRDATCSGAAARLAGVWDETRRQAAQRAFAATQLPFAEDTFAKVAATLDRYTGAWVAMHEEACRATRVEGRQSDRLLDMRMACLDRRRATLGALTSEWLHGVDGQALENAITAAASLPPVDECADARALSERMAPPRDPVAVGRIEAARAHLDRARALGDAKRMREAREQAELARKQADATGFVPVRAEAAFLLGRLIHGFGEPGAVEPLQDAARLAELARDDHLAAEAVVELTGAMADGGLAPSAILLAPVAEALVVRAGDRPQLRGALLAWQGTALTNAGKYAEAAAVLDQARSLLIRSVGPRDPLTLNATFKLMRASEGRGDYVATRALAKELLATSTEALGADHPQTGVVLGRLGLYADRIGDFASARQLIERSIAVAERSFGRTSLGSAVAVNLLGVLEESQGHLDEAQRHYERVLAIRRALLAPDNPLVAHALANLSIITRLQGHLDQALEQVTTALTIMQRVYGPAHADVAYENGLLAEVLADQGDLDGARARYQQEVDTFNRVNGPLTTDTLSATVDFARFYARQGRCADARRLAIPAAAGIEKIGDQYLLAHALVVLARCDVQSGLPADAIRRLERALAVFEKPGAPPAIRGEAHFELARALRASGSGAERALALAQQAEKELAQSGALGARDLERARSWLRRFDPSRREPPRSKR